MWSLISSTTEWAEWVRERCEWELLKLASYFYTLLFSSYQTVSGALPLVLGLEEGPTLHGAQENQDKCEQKCINLNMRHLK